MVDQLKRLGLGLALTTPVMAPLEAIANTLGSRAPRAHLRNEFGEKELTLYFTTSSWALYDNDLADIRTFMRSQNPTSLIIEGHADFRGSPEANLKLASQRAQGVEERLRSIGYDGQIRIVNYGEGKALGQTKEEMKKDRKVMLVNENNPLKRALTQLVGDVYLIDASGSMQGEKWQTVTSYQFPKESQVYGFNQCEGLTRINTPRSISPECGTPLWDSTGKLVEQMANGKSLTLLTDGEDTDSRSYTPRSIISTAKRKGIKISTIGIGISSATQQDLIHIAQQTGGKSYTGN